MMAQTHHCVLSSWLHAVGLSCLHCHQLPKLLGFQQCLTVTVPCMNEQFHLLATDSDLDSSTGSSCSSIGPAHALMPQLFPLLFLSLQLSVDLPAHASQVKWRGGRRRGSQSPRISALKVRIPEQTEKDVRIPEQTEKDVRIIKTIPHCLFQDTPFCGDNTGLTRRARRPLS